MRQWKQAGAAECRPRQQWLVRVAGIGNDPEILGPEARLSRLVPAESETGVLKKREICRRLNHP